MTQRQPASEEAAVGFVLAGGRSSRMGRDKALVEFGGQTLLSRALATLREVGLEAAVAGGRSQGYDGMRVIPDLQPDCGPLGGISAALASASMTATRAEWAVFLSVDMPLVPAALVARLLADARLTGCAVTLASANGWAQTFPVVLNRAVGPELALRLAGEDRSCLAAFRAAAATQGQKLRVLPAELLAQVGLLPAPGPLPAARWFVNVNRPEDLAFAEGIATAAISRGSPIA